LEPGKRITMAQVKADKWFIEGFEGEELPQSAPVRAALTPEQEEQVYQKLGGYGLEREAVKQSVQENFYDHLAATYYLVADRMFGPKVDKSVPASPTTPQTPISAKEGQQTAPPTMAPSIPQPAPAPAAQEEVKKPAAPPVLTTAPAGRRQRSNTVAVPVTEIQRELRKDPTPPPAAVPASAAPQKIPPEKDITAIREDDDDDGDQLPALPAAKKSDENLKKRDRSVTMDAGEHMRKREEENAKEEKPATPASQKLDKPGDEGEPRSLRFSFSVSTTSSKEARVILQEVQRVLAENQIKFTTNKFVVQCSNNGLEFEVEVCKLPRLQLSGLRFKRVSGSSWTYKNLCSTLIEQMQL
jgi:MAP/microtubule affinity-regulating kinase